MRSFRQNLAYVYSVNVLNGLLGILFVPLCLRLLGAEGYGLFSIYGVLASFVSLVDLGVGKNLMRLLASDKNYDVQETHLRNAFGVYLVLSLALILLTPIFLILIPVYIFPVSDGNIGSLRIIIVFSIIEYILIVPISMTQNYCFANERFDRYAKFTLITGITRYSILFFGIFIFSSPSMVVVLLVLRRFLDIFMARRVMGALPNAVWRSKISVREFKSVMAHSAALSTGQMIQSTVISAGTFLVNKYFGLEGLGKYRAAFDLSSKVWFFSNGIGLVIFPKFVRHLSSSSNKEALFSKVYRAMSISWIAYLLIGVIGVLMAPQFLFLMKISDEKILSLFVVLLIGVCLNAHANLSYELLQASAKYKAINMLGVISITVLAVTFYSAKYTLNIYSIGLAWVVSQAIYAIISDDVALQIASIKINSRIMMVIKKIIILSIAILAIAAHFRIITENFTFLSIVILSAWFLVSIKSEIKQLLSRNNGDV